MTKHDLAVRISKKCGLAHSEALEAIETLFDAILESLGPDERIELPNVGVFEVRRRKLRIGRNREMMEKQYPVPARAVAKFKPGKEMKAERTVLAKEEIAGKALKPRLKPCGKLAVMQRYFGAMRGSADLSTNKSYRRSWNKKPA